MEAGRTLFNAVRSGAVSSYTGVKSDWQRERMLVRRLEDMAVLTQRGRRDRAFAAIVRSGFAQVVDKEDKAALDARIDAAFNALKSVDDHNALVHEFKTRGLFEPQVRCLRSQHANQLGLECRIFDILWGCFRSGQVQLRFKLAMW